MMSAARLFVHGVSAEAWAKFHRIEPFSYPCQECGLMLTTSLPFAQGPMRGLAAPPCECGNVMTPYGMVGADKYGDLFSIAKVQCHPRRKKRGPGAMVYLFSPRGLET